MLTKRHWLIGMAMQAAGIAVACDVTGWPSTTHHPSPAKPVAAMELSARWMAGLGVVPESVRGAIRLNLPGATVTVEAERLIIAVPASVTDWTGLRAVVAAMAPASRFDGVTAMIRLPKTGEPPDAARALTAMPGLALVRIRVEREVVWLEVPPDLPYPAAAIWRARKYLAGPPTG